MSKLRFRVVEKAFHKKPVIKIQSSRKGISQKTGRSGLASNTPQ